MLLSCIAQLRRNGKEWRNVRLFGQERNLQGRADYDMRRKLVEADLIGTCWASAPDVYSSPMEACVVVCRTAKPKARRRKGLFINAVDEVTREEKPETLSDRDFRSGTKMCPP